MVARSTQREPPEPGHAPSEAAVGSKEEARGTSTIRAVRGQPTLATVAALAGVSASTVSRVINDSAPVTEAVRATVQNAVDRLGYVPNRAARSLVTQRTDSIALVVREPVGFGIVDPYLSSMTVAASQSLVGSGMHLVVMMAQNGADHAKLASYVRAGHVDGVMLLSVHDDDPLPQQLLRAGIPTVLGGRPMTPFEGCSYLDVDNHGGGQIAARRLIEAGRTQLGTIAGPMDMTAGVDRLDGFRLAVREMGQPPPVVVYGSFTRASGKEAMRNLLIREPDLDAVFCASDMMAIGAMSVLKEAGRRIPDDVAVIGFDDVEVGLHTDPALTTIHQPIAEQARLLVEMLTVHIRTGWAPSIPAVLGTHLVERQSG